MTRSTCDVLYLFKRVRVNWHVYFCFKISSFETRDKLVLLAVRLR